MNKLALALFLVFGVSCTKKDIKVTEQPATAVTVTPASESDLQVFADLEGQNQVQIGISGAPENTTLVCRLNYQRLESCYHGMVITELPPGDYILQVMASDVEDENPTFNATFFSIGSSVSAEPVLHQDQLIPPLTVTLLNDQFRNGQAVRRDQALTFAFQVNAPDGCSSQLYCSLDHRNGHHWHLCDDNDRKKILPEQIAVGLQYLRVIARCGDLSSPVLPLYWYGVHHDYFDEHGREQTLQLTARHSDVSQLINFSLTKPSDCPSSELAFECRSGRNPVFQPCSNLLSRIPPNFAIRSKCGAQIGPIWTLNP